MPYAYPRRGVALSPQALALKRLNADSSPLLRLPGELRNRIYNLVLTSDTPLRLRVVDPPSITYTFVTLATPVLRLVDDKKHMLALLSVCRQLQEEAYMVVFKSNVFEVVDKKGSHRSKRYFGFPLQAVLQFFGLALYVLLNPSQLDIAFPVVLFDPFASITIACAFDSLKISALALNSES
ncbi:hypothetical protein GRF29_1g3471870 [Pseudopithomyces chartarum]|uniref:Uncharacterized protein n=1 Tax=Pseudopithomyces chartarum TaxID=1892770 RepID=A0AAN6M9Z5_9PLEO|nr:hypothetical protein GRF29_1g3471870 [Pseudopithomyces chartarum]